MIKFFDDPETDKAFKNRLMTSTLERKIKIEIDGTEVEQKKIVSESLELKTSIMDAQTFRLGGCISTQLTIKLMNVDSFISSIGGLTEKKITVYIQQNCTGDILCPQDTLYPGNDLYPNYKVESIERQIYTGYIESVNRQQNRSEVEVVAYDEFYRMSRTKCKTAIEGLFEHSPNTIRTLFGFVAIVLELYDGQYNTDFRSDLSADSGFQYDIAPLLYLYLDVDIFKKAADSNLNVLNILEAHCELNARFAYIDEYGNLKFAKLFEYGGHNKITSVKAVDETVEHYSKLTCEDFVTSRISYISFPYNGGDNRFDYGSTDDKRYWYISDNIITSWSSSREAVGALVTAFNNNAGRNYIFGNLYTYRPFSIETFGEWWIETGDKIRADMRYYDHETESEKTFTVESFAFAKTIKGVAGMRVSLEAKGTEFIGKDELEIG